MSVIDRTVDRDMLDLLLETRDAAYAPYSQFQVSAVAVASDGRRFAGCNVETAHFKSICAEASALSAMVGAGRRKLADIYILGPGDSACPPCGDCRQRIFEFAHKGARVILVAEDGRLLQSRTIEELLPDAFGPGRLTPS